MNLRKQILCVMLLVFTSSTSAQLTGVKICIDPGHGGFESDDRHIIPDPGTDFWESESNFRKALHLKALLEARGAIVLLTRNTNSDPSDVGDPGLFARVTFANSNNVDWFHSIHSNATGLPLGQNISSNSTLMLVREQIVEGGDAVNGPGTGAPEWPAAWDMSANYMSPNIQAQNRTTHFRTFRDWTFYGGANGGYTLGVLRYLQMPGELSEGSFHDLYAETRRLMNNDYRKGEAYALTRSFQQFFGAPSDDVGIVCGLLLDSETGKPKNSAATRILPENRVYVGDLYNNGFYFFDSLAPGTHWLRFENDGYLLDSVEVIITAAQTTFADRTLAAVLSPTVTYTAPKDNDTTFRVNGVISIQFSRAMDTASVRAAFSFTPSVPGILLWGNNRTVYFDPIAWLPYSTEYVVRVDTTARSLGGLPLDAANVGIPNELVIYLRTQPQPTSIDPVNNATPTHFALLPAFPNPFNPSTNIRFVVPISAHAALRILDVTGRVVATLLDEETGPGYHTVVFDAKELPSGIYFAELRGGAFRATTKILLVK